MKKRKNVKGSFVSKIIKWIFEKEHSPFLFVIVQTVVTYSMIELLFSGTLIKIKPIFIFMNLGIILGIYLIGLVLGGKHSRLAIWFGNLLFFIYFIAQFYVIDFRGAPIQISDFNIKTIIGGVAIAPNYTLSLYSEVVIAIIVWILEGILLWKIHFSKPTINQQIRNVVCIFLIGIAIIPNLSSTYKVLVEKKEVDFYNRRNPYRKCGHLLMFCMDAASRGIQVPEYYSIEEAKKIADSIPNKKIEEKEKQPNIIAIMNESFADFQNIGSFETDRAVTPFIDEMKENTIKGKVTVSAYGGYSCNSEYEFLTGNTMGFLPPGSTSFTQFLDREQPSLVTALKKRGYWTVGISACEKEIWDLEEGYEQLQFDEVYFEEDWEEKSPETVRGYLKDSYMFEQIIDQFQKKEENTPLFIWNTTMQNHGGYRSKMKRTVHLKGMDDLEEKNQVEVYLTSLQMTDQAVEELIAYFETYEEPTVIAMFGDHYPHLPEFFEALFGKDIEDLSLEELSRKYETPFFIWANYDIEEKTIDSISLNYLSGLIMEAAGIEKTKYQTFLSEVYRELPIISGWGYRDKKGNAYESGEMSEYKVLLEKYQILQYNNLFDERVSDFFDE